MIPPEGILLLCIVVVFSLFFVPVTMLALRSPFVGTAWLHEPSSTPRSSRISAPAAAMPRVPMDFTGNAWCLRVVPLTPAHPPAPTVDAPTLAPTPALTVEVSEPERVHSGLSRVARNARIQELSVELDFLQIEMAGLLSEDSDDDSDDDYDDEAEESEEECAENSEEEEAEEEAEEEYNADAAFDIVVHIDDKEPDLIDEEEANLVEALRRSNLSTVQMVWPWRRGQPDAAPYEEDGVVFVDEEELPAPTPTPTPAPTTAPDVDKDEDKKSEGDDGSDDSSLASSGTLAEIKRRRLK